MTVAVIVLACLAVALLVSLGVAVGAARRAGRAADEATKRADAHAEHPPRPASATEGVTVIPPSEQGAADQAAAQQPPAPVEARPEGGADISGADVTSADHPDADIRAGADVPGAGAGVSAADSAGSGRTGTLPSPQTSPDGGAVARPETVTAAEAAIVAEGTAAPEGVSAGGIPPDDRSAKVTRAMWSLQGVELELERQRDAAVPGAPEAASGVLVGALQREVERIREEMGTPGELHDELGRDPSASAGLLLLRSIQLTLPAVAWRCTGFDLYVFDADGALQARLVCEGFETAAEDGAKAALAAVTEAVAPAGGRVELRKGEAGWAEALVSVPA